MYGIRYTLFNKVHEEFGTRAEVQALADYLLKRYRVSSEIWRVS